MAAVGGAAAPSGNMNGDYIVSSGAGKSAPHFNSDYASKGHEYFDVWSPELATRWPSVPLALGLTSSAPSHPCLSHPCPLSASALLACSYLRYAEVWWHDMGKQALPKEIVARFANKTMAITGYEMDMVMVQPTGQPGAHPAQDVSVPINWAYNHHYETLTLTLTLSPSLSLGQPWP